MTPEELICDLSEFYGYEVDLSYAPQIRNRPHKMTQRSKR